MYFSNSSLERLERYNFFQNNYLNQVFQQIVDTYSGELLNKFVKVGGDFDGKSLEAQIGLSNEDKNVMMTNISNVKLLPRGRTLSKYDPVLKKLNDYMLEVPNLSYINDFYEFKNFRNTLEIILGEEGIYIFEVIGDESQLKVLCLKDVKDSMLKTVYTALNINQFPFEELSQKYLPGLIGKIRNNIDS